MFNLKLVLIIYYMYFHSVDISFAIIPVSIMQLHLYFVIYLKNNKFHILLCFSALYMDKSIPGADCWYWFDDMVEIFEKRKR